MASALNRAECERVYRESLKPVIAGYPQARPLDNRNFFYLDLLARHGVLQPGKLLVDLGAGLSIFGPMARKLGMEVALVDDFGGDGGVIIGQRFEDIKILSAFRDQVGVKICREDFLQSPLPFPDASVDVITCFRQPRTLAPFAAQAFPGNHARSPARRPFHHRHPKRGEHSQAHLRADRPYQSSQRARMGTLEDGDPVFRGHVREPVVRDFRQLMAWNGFEVVGVYGRNFIGRGSEALRWLPSPLVHQLAILSEKMLKFFPTLCSDIHGRLAGSCRGHAHAARHAAADEDSASSRRNRAMFASTRPR